MAYEYSWIEEIEIDPELGYVHEDGQPISIISGLSRINVFVGPTSTGKSRLLRYLATLDNPQVWWGGNDHSRITPKLRELATEGNDFVSLIETLVADYNEKKRHGPQARFDEEISKICEIGDLQPANRNRPPLSIVGDPHGVGLNWSVEQIRAGLVTVGRVLDLGDYDINPLEEYLERCEAFIEDCSNIRDGQIWWATDKRCKYFIPPIRAMNTSSANNSVDFNKLIEDRYFSNLPNGRSVPTIWSGLDVCQKLSSLRDRGDDQFEEFQEFIAKKVLGVHTIEIKLNNDNVFISINNEPSLPIEQLGDGVMHLIVMIRAFFDSLHKFIFIDEPEHGLHPGYIRTFFKAINEIKVESAKQFFIVTHSTQLLDILSTQADTTFFQFRRSNSGVNTIRKIEWGDQAFVREIGVRPGSSMLVNATVWVEGITDRQVYSKWLELYFEENNKPYIEGVHYAITEYGGSTRDHWSFLDGDAHQIDLDSLCGPHMLVLDKDSSNAKLNDRQKVKEILGERAVITPGRELENLYPETLISEACKLWGCNNTNSIKRNSYKLKPLGKFILENTDIDRKITGKNSGPTLTNKYKKDLADLECNTRSLENFTDLDPEIFSELIVPIANFVDVQNS